MFLHFYLDLRVLWPCALSLQLLLRMHQIYHLGQPLDFKIKFVVVVIVFIQFTSSVRTSINIMSGGGLKNGVLMAKYKGKIVKITWKMITENGN